MKYTIEQISKILHLPTVGSNDQTISLLLTDSRRLLHPSETLFVALRTEQQDGHQYINELYNKGVRAFLVCRNFDIIPFPEATFFQVPHPLSALQKLATAWRNNFSIPVVGITGSNGKTIVKEWLFQLLHPDFHMVRSPKSFNSQTGVPLSIAEMNASHEIALFEAGISQPGEMEKLEKMIRPSIGIFTNIGEAHAEGFKSQKEKIRQKLLLFKNAQILIFHKEENLLTKEIAHFQRKTNQEGNDLQLFSWSTQKESNADLLITEIKKDGSSHSCIKGIFQQEEQIIQIPFTDKGSVEDAIHCWCLLLYLGLKRQVITKRMKQLQPVAMRLEMKPGIRECILINDSYNSDFTSIKVALDFLFHQNQKNKHTLILSDVEQSGVEGQELYQKIVNVLIAKKIDRFIGIGPKLCSCQSLFKDLSNKNFYPTTADFIASIKNHSFSEKDFPFQDEIILIKGARSFAFEKINRLLEQKKHQTELTINLNAVVHNLKTYQSLLKPGVKTMVMVKAFSYGSGSAEIAGLLQYHRVDYLAVANIDEGIHLRQKGINLPVLILNPDPFYFEDLIRWELEPEIYTLSMLYSFRKKVASLGITHYPIHLNLDTGMHRLGFMEENLPTLVRFLKEQDSLQVISIFSHLAASEDPTMDSFTKAQGHLFEKMSLQIKENLSYPVIRHMVNSSGISRHPYLQYDMVRLGIGLYGIEPAIQEKLEVVHTLKAVISQIKTIKSGETVGYGRSGKVSHSKRIAIVALGYADGYLRSLGLGKGKMYIHGKYAPTIGQVCMDMLMLDITHIPEAEEGEYVTVFGEAPKIVEVSQNGGTIPYELLTGLSRRIIRVYTQE